MNRASGILDPDQEESRFSRMSWTTIIGGGLALIVIIFAVVFLSLTKVQANADTAIDSVDQTQAGEETNDKCIRLNWIYMPLTLDFCGEKSVLTGR